MTQKGVYSDPVRLILRDRPFQIGIVLWVLLCVGIVYGIGFGLNGDLVGAGVTAAP